MKNLIPTGPASRSGPGGVTPAELGMRPLLVVITCQTSSMPHAFINSVFLRESRFFLLAGWVRGRILICRAVMDSVHEFGYGHKFGRAAPSPVMAEALKRGTSQNRLGPPRIG
jgi:hypothetical protein